MTDNVKPTEFEAQLLLDIHNGVDRKWGAAVGAAIEECIENGWLSASPDCKVTPLGLAVLLRGAQ